MEDLMTHLSNLGITSTLPQYTQSNPLLNPIDVYRSYLTEILVGVTGVNAETVFPTLQWARTLDRGDLVLAVPQLQARGAKPAAAAAEWAQKFKPNALFSTPEAESIFIRFYFSPQLLPCVVLPCIFHLASDYGLNRSQGFSDPGNPSSGRKKVVIEFSSPNIAKEFHAGHLRSTIIGGFLSNLFEGAGWDVTRMNYLGDWGRQYGVLAVAWNMFGSEQTFEANPIGHLFDIYVRISALIKPEEDVIKAAKKEGQDTTELESTGLLGQAKTYFKRMEDGDEEVLSLWRRFRVLSIEKYKTTYARLNIFFNDYSGESQVKPESMAKAEAILERDEISEIDKGATIIDFKKHGAPKLGVAIIRNRNGTTNYLLRDVGAAVERWDRYQFDKMIYVVMSEQDIHLQRLFKILDLIGYGNVRSRMEHVNFGKVQGMSTRRGNVKFLNDILEDCGTAMHEVMRRNEAKYNLVDNPEEIADTLGISAVMVQDMSGKRINNYPFDLERMTSFEGDTGPYLQYAHARLRSIAAKTGWSSEQLQEADFTLLKEPHAINLIRIMAQYPDVVGHTMKTLEPATILTYLFRLTHQLSSSYDVLRVVGAQEGEAVSMARAALYEAARQVISNGMRLLGLTPVDRM
ncbi:hypothetical protein MMC16_002174 [Acarospora aff. strigata]|nr:hypothetical protein [Acarospora aff. strigata]